MTVPPKVAGASRRLALRLQFPSRVCGGTTFYVRPLNAHLK